MINLRTLFLSGSFYLLCTSGAFADSDASDANTTPTETSYIGGLIQFEPIPETYTLGLFADKHRADLFFSRTSIYRSLGFEYAYHLRGVKSSGFYGTLSVEHRRFNSGLTANKRLDSQTNTWSSDVVDNHKANLYAAILGYQWLLFSSDFYVKVGLGWQYNNNPIDLGPVTLGSGISNQRWSEATGEFGIGWLFD